MDEYVTHEGFIKKILTENSRKIQIVNFNINYVDDRFAKTITKIYSIETYLQGKVLQRRRNIPI